MKKFLVSGSLFLGLVCLVTIFGCTTATTDTTTTTATAASTTTTATSSTTTTTSGGTASWKQVGSTSFSSGYVDTTISLVVYNGTPYVAYRISSTDRVGVLKFNGTNWEAMGTEGFVGPGGAYYSFAPSLAVYDASHIYVAMSQADSGWTRTPDYVMKYNSGSNIWEAYGNAYSAGGADGDSLAIDSAGIPYVAFVRQSVGIVEVRKYNAGTGIWDLTQSSLATGEHTSLQLVNDQPYVGFNYLATGFRGGAVLSWEAVSGLYMPVGDICFTPLGTSESPSAVTLAMDGSTPYIGFGWFASSPWGQKVDVWKYNGGAWEQVGGDYLSGSGYAGSPSLAVNGHQPYIAYIEGGKGYVKYFNGTSWQLLGGAAFDDASVVSLCINNNIPYVAYRDINGKLSVMKYAP